MNTNPQALVKKFDIAEAFKKYPKEFHELALCLSNDAHEEKYMREFCEERLDTLNGKRSKESTKELLDQFNAWTWKNRKRIIAERAERRRKFIARHRNPAYVV